MNGTAGVALRRRSILLMTLCAALWSIAGIFIKLIPWNAFVIAGFRSLIAGGVMALYMKRSGVRFCWNRSSVLAGVALCMTLHFFVAANKLTTAANAIVLQFTAPVFIILISTIVLCQRFRRSDYVVVGVVLLGIALCFLDQIEAGSLLGNLLGVCSGFFFAAMFVVTGSVDNDSRMSGLLLGHIFTAVVGIPMVAVFDTAFDTQSVVCILILGVLQLGIPYILYGLAVANCPPLVCCLTSAIEPLLNPVWVFLFDGELPGMPALLGGVIVIATITIWNIWSARSAARVQEQ